MPAAALRRSATALCCAAGLAAGAGAQTVELAPSDALRCLTPGPAERHAVDYPFTQFKTGQKGRVRVDLRFGSSTAGPELKVLESEGGAEFVDAVKEQVANWRVPCLAKGQSVTLQQEYVFRPDGRKVFWSGTTDGDDPDRLKAQACMAHVSGKAAPGYPYAAQRRNIQGYVIAELQFASAEAAPRVKVHSRPLSKPLAEAIEEWAVGYRVPCLKDGQTLNTIIRFRFFLKGSPGYGFRNADLRQILPLVAGIGQQSLAFDTTQMGCPFDVRFSYRRPWLPNAVGSVGSEDPARSELLEWLASVEFKLPDKDLDAIYGDDTTFTVPCLKIELNPKEKT